MNLASFALLSGTIPSEIGNLWSLQALHLSNNRLSGPIPSEMGNLRQLQRLYLDGNRLTSTIPEQVCYRKNPLLTFQFEDNLLTGTCDRT
eukprot:CAMPEP_0113653786 /NCGR_PEP_ID=MMETSP0017_2-20120614/28781_1 /TAXON_ID=2856 /ORGANISM="Cylindrotheca closterium" /LENGTH=89 /DNA_ID=CAMNT_0000566835 /DNA_START=27 /DNA_END=299 /DNA_ORIENTATION=- /assembly_acc=CAM_ASM_000147